MHYYKSDKPNMYDEKSEIVQRAAEERYKK